MYPPVAVVCTTAILLHGVSCSQAILEHVSNVRPFNRVYKRQGDNVPPLPCALGKFDAFYKGNNSNFVRNCRSAILGLADVGIITNQSAINIHYRTVCIPECGNVVLDAFDDCGVFNIENIEGQRSYTAGLCGSNENGSFCYEYISDSGRLIVNADSCSDECDCDGISEIIQREGCCIDGVNRLDLFDDRFNLNDAYTKCRISVPDTGCNNSPLRGSNSLPRASFISTVAILLVTFFNLAS